MVGPGLLPGGCQACSWGICGVISQGSFGFRFPGGFGVFSQSAVGSFLVFVGCALGGSVGSAPGRYGVRSRGNMGSTPGRCQARSQEFSGSLPGDVRLAPGNFRVLSLGMSGPAVSGAAELPGRARRALLMKAAALLLSAPGGGRCHQLLVRALASLMRCRVSRDGPRSAAGPINLGQAFPGGPGMVCAGFVPRPGLEMCCSPQGTGGGWQHPAPSSCSPCLPAPSQRALESQGEGVFQLLETPFVTEEPRQSCIPKFQIPPSARQSRWDGECTEPRPIHREFR